MSSLLGPPPTIAAFDDNGIPSRAWVDWTTNAYRYVKKFRGADTTANRPIHALESGDWYWDSTLSKPIWYTGSGWKDATGAAV